MRAGSKSTAILFVREKLVCWKLVCRHPDLFKRCIFDAFLFNPACAKVPVRTTNSHAQSISPASCRSKRVDDHSRFYANFRDFRGARVSTLTPHVLKPNADPVVLT